MTASRIVTFVLAAALGAGFVAAAAAQNAAGPKAGAKKAAIRKILEARREAAKQAAVPAGPPVIAVPAKSAAAPSFESVSPQDASALASLIDSRVGAKLAAEKVAPSARASDAEFLRRVYLDLTGSIPSAEQAAAFLDSRDAQKRAKLIDELLASPAFGGRMADAWMGLMVERNSDNRFVRFGPLRDWLADKFNANTPWDKLARDILTAEGTAEDNPAAVYYLSNVGIDKLNDSVTRLFLGVRLECCQCHNHPFTDYKQEEYWGMAQFFTKVKVQKAGNPKKNPDQKPGVGEAPRRVGKLPEDAKVVPAKFLGGASPRVGDKEPLRPVLADWLTKPENPYFAKAFVNRAWAQLFGIGIVNPIDDLHPDNAPSHPELLAELAKRFGDGKFDVKQLFRGLCNSEAYQRTSRPTAGNKSASTSLYARQDVKLMTPEQLFDSLAEVVGKPGEQGRAKGKAGNAGAKGQQLSPRDRFAMFFDTGEDPKPTEYEAGIPQALKLMNSPQLTNTARVAQEMARSGSTPAKVIETLYLATLSRRPTPEEASRLQRYVAAESPAAAYGDILWALINSSEFTIVR